MRKLFTLLLLLPLQIFAQRQGVIVNSNFDSHNVPPGLKVQKCCDYSETFEGDTTRFGYGLALRFELDYNMPLVASSKRNELSGTPSAQGEGWYGLSMYVPPSFASDTLPDLVTQYHNIEPAGKHFDSTPPVTLRIQRDSFFVQIQWSNDEGMTHNGSLLINAGPVTKSKWIDWVWHIKWSYNGAGITQVWRDGVKVVDRIGPNAYNDGNNPYFKCGIYKSVWAHGYVTAGITHREMYFDEVRIATAAGNYNSVAPAIDTPFITATRPAGGYPRETIVIKGVSFIGSNSVLIGGVPATFTVNDDKTITAVVPTGTKGDSITVTNHNVRYNYKGFNIGQLVGSISGGTTVCLNSPQPDIMFNGDNGVLPFTYTYTLNDGPEININTTGLKKTVKISVPDSVAGSYNYKLLSITDSLGNTLMINKGQAIKVVAPSTSTTTVNVCQFSLPYHWNGTDYTQSGNYTIHLSSSTGCDSAATLALTVGTSSSSISNIAVCAGDLPYQWNGGSYTEAGTYIAHLTTASGCDSAATLNLTVKQPTTSSTAITIEGKDLPYKWNDKTYSESGVYTVHLTNTAGCDSTATLLLTVQSSPNSNSLLVTVYPNPTKSTFNLKVLNGNTGSGVSLVVVNIAGEVVYRATGKATDIYSFGDKFPTGVYIVQMVNGSLKANVKLIKSD